ncbi:hypothetical protein D3Z52_06090 [Clostridiaceae bacterium]|nr:hypothetical protein [Clostridiaceae bacterium]
MSAGPAGGQRAEHRHDADQHKVAHGPDGGPRRTDLTDPVQCAAVAIDYLQELESRYGFEPESEALLMAYNMGPSGARKALNEGRTSTDYSREIMTVYQGYLEELER